MYGVEGLREKIRYHIKLAAQLAELIAREKDFEILAPVNINVVCFRFKPEGIIEAEINKINETLNHQLNDTGKIYLSHTVINEIYALRMVTGQTNVRLEHVEKAWDLIRNTARSV